MCFKIFSFKNFILAGVGILMVEESRVLNTIALNEMRSSLLGFNIFSKETNKASASVLPKIFSISDILTTVRPSVSIEKIHETAHNPFKSPTIKPRASRSRAGSFNSKLRPETLERELEVISSPSIPLEEGSKSITSPVFKHFNQLRETAYFLKTLFQIDAHTDLQISSTAFYNPSKNAVIIIDPSVSHLASAIKSPSTIELLTIGGKNIPRENITILESSAVERQSPKLISSRSGKRNSQMGLELLEFRLNKAENSISDNFRRSTIDFGHNGSIELTDISLYQSTLESFGTKWVPIMASITDQLSKNQAQPLIPEFHLFNGISVQGGLAREISTIGSTTVIFENYNIHAYLNPGFLKDVFPLKLTRPMYSTISEAELFITQAGLRELGYYSQGIISGFGELIIAAEFRVNKNGVINKLFVYDNSNLASVLKDSKKVSIVIKGNEISKIKFSSSGESFLGKPLNSLIGPKKEDLDIPLTEFNPWSLTNAFNMEFSQFLNSFKTRGIIAVLEHRPTGIYTNLVTHFYPVLEEFVIYINSKLINSTAFLTVDTPKGSISRYVPFIPSIEYSSNQVPGYRGLLNYKLALFVPKDQSIILTRNTPFSELSTEVTSYNIRLSPIFEDFGELSSVSEHLFSMIHKLEDSKEKTFVRIKPVALYHPSQNRVAILEGSLLERHHMTLQAETLSANKTIQFTNGFENPRISIYNPKDFKELLDGENLIRSLELNSFNKSPHYIYNKSWNPLFIGILNDSYSSEESIILGLFKEAKLLRGLFTREFQYNAKDWSYELLTKELTQRSYPLFNSYNHLVSSIKPLRLLLNISERAPINISAFYNPSSNRLVVSNPEKSLFGKLLESLKTSAGGTLTIGQREVPFDNIIFAIGDALDHLLDVNVSGYAQKVLWINDSNDSLLGKIFRESLTRKVVLLRSDEFFKNPLENHGDKWVPIMFRIWEQFIQEPSFPISPDIYLFDNISIFNGLGKEVFSPMFSSSSLSTTPITLENYTRHIFMNPYFLREISPVKLTKHIYPSYKGTGYYMERFVTEVSLIEHNLSEGARIHLGSLIPSGGFYYSKTGIKPAVIVYENTKLEQILKSNPDSFFRLNGEKIGYEFKRLSQNFQIDLSEKVRLNLKNPLDDTHYVRWFMYSFDYLQIQKIRGSHIPPFEARAFFEHKTSTTNPDLMGFDLPIYPVFEGLELVSKSVTNKKISLIKNLGRTSFFIEVPYIVNANRFQTRTPLNIREPLSNALRSNPDMILTPIFKDFEHLSIVSENNLRKKTNPFFFFRSVRIDFVEIHPTGIYEPSTGKIFILDESHIGSIYNREFPIISFKNNQRVSEIILSSRDQFLELIKGRSVAHFINPKDPSHPNIESFPILVEISYPRKTIFPNVFTMRLFQEIDFSLIVPQLNFI